MLRIDLTDGTVLGFTDHNQLLSFDLGDGTGAVDYRPDQGMQVSNITTGTGLDAANFEVTFPIATAPRPITREAVIGGRFHRCEARLFEVIWSNLAAGPRKFLSGNSGEWRVEGGAAIAEVRDQRDRLNQTLGRILQNQCDADYADQVRCFATPTEMNATVTAVTDAMRFTVTNPDARADGVFDKGRVSFSSGGNAGTRPVPIETWTSAGVVTLFMPLVEAPQVGDTLTLRDGCDLTRLGPNGCRVHGQILNFRGFPEVPGNQALKPAIPAQGDASGGKGK